MKTFEELGVSPEIRRAIEEMGYEQPMPVQEEVIPYLLGENNDVVALAQTGTGKTAAFGLPLIQKINVNNRIPQSLILCPTRELCLQIAGDLNDYSKYTDGLRVLPVYGGSSIESQIRALKRGVHIIVATPGRLLDLMERKTVSLATIQNVVMDEADEMLNMGFTDSINAILADVPQERNTLLFSATMSPEIARISKKYLRDAKEITIGRKNESTSNVKHVAFCVHAKDKYAALKRIVDYYPQIYGIIFCRTRKETQEIADKLMQEGYNADSLHGELSQAQRDAVMQKFRIRNLQLLVATDRCRTRPRCGRPDTRSSTTDCPMTPRVIPTAAAVRDVPAKPGLPSPSSTCERKAKCARLSASSARNSLQAKCPPANRYAKSNCSK